MESFDLTEVFINHYKTYPNMEIQDFLKLLYQSCFGPFHLHGNPSKEVAQSYLEKELLGMVHTSGRYMEDIGNGYIRIYLDAILVNKISQEKLLSQFVTAMNEAIDVKRATELFHIGLQQLIHLSIDGSLPYSKTECEQVIHDYLVGGIKPIHHSSQYRDQYHPHYRVIRKY